jgi:hypothetical protein
MGIPPDSMDEPRLQRPLVVAIACGAIPLTMGVIIYLLWRLTWWDWLAAVGIANIGIGLVFVFIGSINLLLSFVNPASRKRRGEVLTAFLLIANFPAAALCVYSAQEVRTRYTVEVFNETNLPISSFVLIGPGVAIELGPIGPGEHAQRHLHFKGVGELGFAAKQRTEFAGTIDGYVCDLPDHKLIHVRGPQSWSIEDGPNSFRIRHKDATGT